MGIVHRVFAASAILLAGAAGAQQQEAPSPYSLGFGTGRAPLGLKDVSVIGRAQLSAFSAFGRVGTTTSSRPDTAMMGMSPTTTLPLLEPSPGLSWGGGVSWDFSPRLTATFEWLSYDLRMAAGPVRATNLGLQYRY